VDRQAAPVREREREAALLVPDLYQAQAVPPPVEALGLCVQAEDRPGLGQPPGELLGLLERVDQREADVPEGAAHATFRGCSRPRYHCSDSVADCGSIALAMVLARFMTRSQAPTGSPLPW